MNTQSTQLHILFSLILFLLTSNAQKKSFHSLETEMKEFLKTKKATVGISIYGVNSEDKMSINGNTKLPMQSVYKFHLALAVLNLVDKGELNLNQMVVLDKNLMNRYKHLWSPIRKKYPEGIEMSLSDIIKYTVGLSDNVGCDMLFKLVGGPKVVQDFMQEIGIKDVSIVHNEFVMQSNWENQFQNWTTTNASNQLLKIFYENKDKIWSNQSHGFLLEVLKETKTGKKSIKGYLPKESVVAHKTGHSGKNNDGITGAVNDIGIVFLKQNRCFYLSVMVSNSEETDADNQEIIAEIAKLTWNYFTTE